MSNAKTSFALIAILIAGCSAPPQTGDGEASAEFHYRPIDIKQLPIEDRGIPDAMEPSIVADDLGNVFATAARKVILSVPHPTESVTASWLWASRDGGRTFDLTRPLQDSIQYPPAGTEGHLSVSPDGTVYFVDLTLASFSLSVSNDHGRTWEPRNILASNIPAGDRPWVAAGPGGRVHVVWNQIPSGFWVLTSEDGGRTFPTMVNVEGTMAGLETLGIAAAPDGYEVPGVPIVGPDGTLYIARGEGDSVALYVSRDGGKTLHRNLAWQSTDRVGWIFSTPAVDEAGILYVSTVEVVDGTTRVRYAYSSDGGASFSVPKEVARTPGVHALQWGAAGRSGEFGVAFYAAEGSGLPSDVVGEWKVHVAVTRNAASPNPSFHELAVSAHSVHEGPICTGGTVGCGNDQTRALADYLGLDWSPFGEVHTVWTDAANGKPVAMYGRLEPVGDG